MEEKPKKLSKKRAKELEKQRMAEEIEQIGRELEEMLENTETEGIYYVK